MNNLMTCFSPAAKKYFSPVTEDISLSAEAAENHLDALCPEWVYSLKTRRDAVETLMASGYHPDFTQRSDGATEYQLTAMDGRYFPLTPIMFEYAVSLQMRDKKGFYFQNKVVKEGKRIANNHEMAYS